MNAPLATHETHEVAPLVLTPPSDTSPEAMWNAWRCGIRGAPIPFDPMKPEQGLYRYRPRRADRGQPCQIWWDALDAVWRAAIAGAEVEDVAGAWRFCHQYPVTKAAFDAVTDGGLWPDETAAGSADELQPAGMGHNSRTPQEEIRDEIESADRAFAAWLAEQGGAITTEEQDEAAMAWTARFHGFAKRIEAGHKSEKEPVLAEARRIDAAWITGPTSLKAYAEACKKRPGEVALPYRLHRDQLAAEARRKAEEDARLAREAERARMLQAQTAGVVPPPPVSRPAAAPTFVAPKATGLRKSKVAVITDIAALAAHIAAQAERPSDFDEACRRRAEALLKAGAPCPGAILEEKVSAR